MILFRYQYKNLQWFIDNGFLPNPNSLMYIYDEGVIPDYIGGLDTTNGGNGSVTLNEKYVQFTCSQSNVYQFVGTKKLINVTPYKKLCAKVEILTAVNDTYDSISLYINNQHLTSANAINYVSTNLKGSIVELEMDISEISGSYYITLLSLYCSSSRVHSIWLE